jgi:hypothetical protein
VPADIDPRSAKEVVTSAMGSGDELWLAPAQARALLDAYGIPLVHERQARTEDEAVAAVRELGYPAVVKTAAPGAHKTETGGVALDLRDEVELREAVARVGLPAMVQPMIRGNAELLAGVVQDPVFGPLVAFGPGGVLAELIGQAQIRIAPLTDAEAGELVLGGKAGRLVRGFRGPECDASALIELVQRLSQLADDLPEVAELDLNPVIGLPEGCVVVDSRARLRRHRHVERPKTW